MPVSIRVAGATFTKIIGSVVPYYLDLEAYFLLGGTLADSRTNRARVGGLATTVGSPTVNATGMVVTEANGLETDIVVSGAVSYVGVVTYGGVQLFFGNADYTGSVTNLSSVGYYGSDWVLQNESALRAKIANTVVPASGTRFIAGTISSTERSLYVSNGGVLSSNDFGSGSANVTINPFRVGACGSGSFAGTPEIHAAMYFSRALSAVEVGVLYDYLKTVMAERGVTVE